MTADPVNFKEALWFAERARAAYDSEAQIRARFPGTTRVTTLDPSDVQYFIEILPEQQLQVVSIRGTADFKNIKEDAEYFPSSNLRLGIFVHQGFAADATALYADVLPHLDRKLKIRVTGHSLGAAISTLLMMFLHEDGFQVQRSINFGQPKLTNRKGVEAYSFLDLVRVVDENDLIPLVPPMTLLDALHGPYEHLGREVILLRDRYFASLEQSDAARKSALSFWENLGHESIREHFMDHYLENLRVKQECAEEVLYADRERYV